MNQNPLHTLRAESLAKAFAQGTSTVPVLTGVNAEFVQGSSVAITGASGSGKSTLLHLLAGVDEPDTGAVRYDGVSLAQMNNDEQGQFLNRAIGLMFQAPYLVDELTVLENVMIKGLIAGKSHADCAPAATELLREVGLPEKADALPATLSGGQQQRVALARALFGQPAFVLADEPTGNLDRETGKQIIDMVLRVTKTWGAGLIVVSHDPYVEQMVDQVWHLNHGTLERKR
jgi:lipoprotein-releasing system ATP-binding protein